MLLPKILFALALSVLELCAQDGNTIFSTNVRVVNLYASVHDDQGRVVRDLSKNDFTLDEDVARRPFATSPRNRVCH